MKKSYLLPHAYRRAGVWALISAALVLAAYVTVCMVVAFRCENADALLSRTSLLTIGAYNLTYALVCVGIVLFAFSRERFEDEMIDAVRRSSVVRAAYTVFLFYMTVMLAGCVVDFVSAGVGGDGFATVENILKSVEDPMVMFLFYQLFFRVKLAKLRRALNNEEE